MVVVNRSRSVVLLYRSRSVVLLYRSRSVVVLYQSRSVVLLYRSRSVVFLYQSRSVVVVYRSRSVAVVYECRSVIVCGSHGVVVVFGSWFQVARKWARDRGHSLASSSNGVDPGAPSNPSISRDHSWYVFHETDCAKRKKLDDLLNEHILQSYCLVTKLET